jgi:hypothetical protein
MQTTLKTAVEGYFRSKTLSRGTRNEYSSTLKKWAQWGGGVPMDGSRLDVANLGCSASRVWPAPGKDAGPRS